MKDARARIRTALAFGLLFAGGLAGAGRECLGGERPEVEYARWVRSGIKAFEAGNYEEAASLFRKALRLKSEAGTWFNLGVAHFLGKQTGEAEEAFRKAVQLKKGRYPEAQRYLGRLLYAKGDWTGTIQALSASLSPGGDTGLWRIMAAAFEQLEDDGNMRRALEMAVLAEPGDANLRSALAQALYREGRYESARVEFIAALRVRPGDPRLHTFLGFTLTALQKEVEAIDVMETALRLGSKDRSMILALADLYARKEMHREAAKAFALVVDAKTAPPRDLYRLSVLHLRAGELDPARSGFERVLEKDPRFVPAMLALGNLEVKTRHHDKARGWYEKALKIAPDTVEAFEGLGDIAYAEKQYASAVTSYEKALVLHPGSSGTWRRLGHAEFSLGHFGAAAKAYRRALEFDPADREAGAYLSATESMLRHRR
ncbi:MAG: tetratricopeptide repeat protein [Planctomycetota bacterium]|jgi:tetratricopeptide (TPR) repeat protein